ncbi:hypothetical protein PF010_g32120 [Phytophthora fragariae]|uniref:Uncharacterized protein n=1 Tax=Phytophthora fragariae TaxID=53985 RepID=A0A6G0JFE5_9STRA|nr:hypothetical protein PF003_g2503 [Phytophthora fragariae]KAE9055520.1 hypothetical protein PF010_g32120 [Phytophthora fragariae]
MRRWAQARSRSTPFSTWLRPAVARGCVRQRSVVASGTATSSGGVSLCLAAATSGGGVWLHLAAVRDCVRRGDVLRRCVAASGVATSGGGVWLRLAAVRGCVWRRRGVACGGGEVIASGGSDLEMKG